jgi:hypothetical protein
LQDTGQSIDKHPTILHTDTTMMAEIEIHSIR